MPIYKHERHGTHIANLNEREELEKNGWVLIVDEVKEVLDKQEQPAIIQVREEPQVKRSPGRPKKQT